MKSKSYSNFIENFNNENEKRNIFHSNTIWFFFVLMLIIITLFRMRRIYIFIKIFNSASVPFQITGIIIYIIALLFLMIYHLINMAYVYLSNDYPRYNILKLKSYINKMDLLKFISKSISILLFLFIFIINPCRVYGQSMADTFNTGDRVLTTALVYSPNKDDIIIFDATNYRGDESFYIKRVIAKENDKISYINNNLYVNDIKDERGNVSYSEYLRLVESILSFNNNEGESDFYHVIPKNKLIVLGDNRLNSTDSRTFGLIDVDDVYGKVILRFYPFNKIEFF